MKLEVAGKDMITEVVDHYGLIAAICKDLKISELINERMCSKDPRKVVQPGVAVVAMIINALGFTNRTLYLTPQFYISNAIALFFDEQITADDLNDHTLGKALDEISNYGATRLFGEIAFIVLQEMGRLGKLSNAR